MNENWRSWKFAGIYAIQNTINNKIYIGQSKNITKRIYGHKSFSQIGRKQHLYNAINKYGWDAFRIVLLEKVDNIFELNEREQYWISFYNATDHSVGYNTRSFSDLKRNNITKIKITIPRKGRRHSEETRIKMCIVQRQRSMETRIKTSLSRQKLYHTQEHTEILLNYVMFNCYVCISSIVNKIGIKSNTAYRLLNQAGWYKRKGCWQYYDDKPPISKEISKSHVIKNQIVKQQKNKHTRIERLKQDRLAFINYIRTNPCVSFGKVAKIFSVAESTIYHWAKLEGWSHQNGYWCCTSTEQELIKVMPKNYKLN
jgi:group I intron endonuclease